jgi:hypothetical protein
MNITHGYYAQLLCTATMHNYYAALTMQDKGKTTTNHYHTKLRSARLVAPIKRFYQRRPRGANTEHLRRRDPEQESNRESWLICHGGLLLFAPVKRFESLL